MFKVLPIKKEEVKCEPRFDVVITIGYGEHCDDTYTYNRKTVSTNKKKNWDYIDEKDAEELVTLINRSLNSVDHIVLNEGISDFWCEGMKKADIKRLRHFYDRHQSLFWPEIEHNWYGITGACVKFLDEHGNWHDVEIV